MRRSSAGIFFLCPGVTAFSVCLFSICIWVSFCLLMTSLHSHLFLYRITGTTIFYSCFVCCYLATKPSLLAVGILHLPACLPYVLLLSWYNTLQLLFALLGCFKTRGVYLNFSPCYILAHVHLQLTFIRICLLRILI